MIGKSREEILQKFRPLASASASASVKSEASLCFLLPSLGKMLQTRIRGQTLRHALNAPARTPYAAVSPLAAGRHPALSRVLSPLTVCAPLHLSLQVRGYAQGPPGGGEGIGGKGGFPGFSLGPQHQKGEALKEYVRLTVQSALRDSVLMCFA